MDFTLLFLGLMLVHLLGGLSYVIHKVQILARLADWPSSNRFPCLRIKQVPNHPLSFFASLSLVINKSNNLAVGCIPVVSLLLHQLYHSFTYNNAIHTRYPRRLCGRKHCIRSNIRRLSSGWLLHLLLWYLRDHCQSAYEEA